MENKAPKVSIVTAMYKHKPYLKRRIDSILNQTMQDWEWIIVDDCSPDGSFEYARELTRLDSRVTVLQNEANRHIAYTNQRGIDLARGEFLYRTDSDDYCDYRFLERMAGILEQHPSVVMAHCRGLSLDHKDGAWGGWPKKKEYVVNGWEEFRRNLIQYSMRSPTILFRRNAVVEAGGFATLPLLCNHDWYLSLRVCLLGDIAYIDEPLAAHRRHGSNLSEDLMRQTDARQMEIELYGVIDDVISRLPPERTAEGETLRAAAYQRAALALLAVVRWARSQGLESQAQDLETMIHKYVSPEKLSVAETKPNLMPRLLEWGSPHIKRMTYRKLPPIGISSANQAEYS